ncbi:hypothetical protein BDN72DRAFT_939751 [Pluteus cervinus]|uniref:Uncharacterized protein n=1 Tax=Pluteus cervinus TaxID=181527 RepID=A0ACD3AYL6_9AGAR|nr:hypothetical protein BDN72DRAFT_939751 [Pluteus cervinus]
MSSTCDFTPTMDSNSAERDKIDEEIVTLSEALRELRAKRNNLAPIARLPPELLLRIFKLVQKDKDQRAAYSWIAITRVSQYWRVVTITAKVLWCDITFNKGDSQRPAIDACLRRSGSLPLDVYISDSYSSSVGFYDLTFSLLDQLSRIRLLSIYIRFSDTSHSEEKMVEAINAFTRLQNALLQPAPHLEEICLSASLLGSSDLWQSIALRLPVLLGGKAPQLMSLAVSDMPVNLDGFISQNLTTLKLSFYRYAHRIPIHTLLRLLAQTNRIRILELKHGFSVPDDAEESLPVQRVFLPHLQNFSLEAGIEEIRAVLPYLVLSTDAKVYINVDVPGSGPNPGSPLSLLDLIGDSLNHPVEGWSTAAIYVSRHFSSIQFVFWDEEANFEHLDSLDARDEVYLIEQDEEEGESELMRTRMTVVQFALSGESVRDWLVVPRSFKTMSVSRLRLRYQDLEWLGEGLRGISSSFLSSFSQIISLSLDGSPYINAFLDFIHRPTPGSEIFPFLEHLCVHLPWAKQKELLEKFWKALHHRSLMGHKSLKELTLRGLVKENNSGEFPLKVEGIRVVDNLVVHHYSD